MEIALTKDQSIYLSLLKIIPISDICKKIINIKNKIEKEEALSYHIEIWELGASKFFKAIETYYPIISYVINDKEYIVNTDKHLDYYLFAGYSYQVRDLLLDLIRSPDKNWRKYDDIIYCVLADKINNQVKLSIDNFIQSLELD